MNRHQVFLKSANFCTSAVALSILAFSAHALPLVENGSFTLTSAGPNKLLPATMPTGWTYAGGAPGIAVIYSPGAADTFGSGVPFLWGPNNSSVNVFSDNHLTDTSPDGGNYLASDSDPNFSGVFSQTISDLTPGKDYILSFYYAAAQFSDDNGNWNGKTESRWQVGLGDAGIYDTPVLKIDSHGFSGWMHETHTFKVPETSDGSELLTFFAIGHPGGLPPVALLDGISLNAVPEPETIALLSIGLLGILATSRPQRSSAPVRFWA